MTKLICCLVGDDLTVKVLEKEISVEIEALFGEGCTHKFETEGKKGGLFKLTGSWWGSETVVRFGDIWITEIKERVIDEDEAFVLEKSVRIQEENIRLQEIIKRLEILENKI